MANVSNLRPTKAPNLQVAPLEYNRQNEDLFRAQLRAYLNTVDNVNRELVQAAYSQSVMAWLDGCT